MEILLCCAGGFFNKYVDANMKKVIRNSAN